MNVRRIIGFYRVANRRRPSKADRNIFRIKTRVLKRRVLNRRVLNRPATKTYAELLFSPPNFFRPPTFFAPQKDVSDEILIRNVF